MSVGCGCDEFRWRRLVTRRHLLKGGVSVAALGLHLPWSRYIALAREGTPVAAGERTPIQEQSPVVNGSFVNPLVEIYGQVEIGQRSYIAGNTILYDREGVVVSLGNENNCLHMCALRGGSASDRVISPYNAPLL